MVQYAESFISLDAKKKSAILKKKKKSTHRWSARVASD